jgi:hypothetical protein
LILARQILEELMIHDPRVKVNPPPSAYVISMNTNEVELSAT